MRSHNSTFSLSPMPLVELRKLQLKDSPNRFEEGIKAYSNPACEGYIHQLLSAFHQPFAEVEKDIKGKAMTSKMSDSSANLPQSKMIGAPEMHFHAGARFMGVQRSRFEGNLGVKVDLLNVDRDNDSVCGYITVIDLNYESDHIQRTYFNGEIISKRYPFATRKWFADAETDKMHWWKFGCFYKYLSAFDAEGDLFDYSQLKNDDVVYMRWKEEKGIGSDHAIVGPGFHYVRLNKATGILESFYYERYRSEWCESAIHCAFVRERGIPVYEFR